MFCFYVLGDSISIQYGPHLQKMVEGLCEYSRKSGEEEALKDLDIPQGANGGDSRMVLEYLKYLISTGWTTDLLVVNCGLHDMRKNPPERNFQVAPEQYRKNLAAIFAAAKENGIPVLWVRSTPAITEVHNSKMDPDTGFMRYTEDLIEYNRIADDVAAQAGVFVADLYSFTKNLGGNEVFADHVHFVEEVQKLHAAFLAGIILEIRKELAAGN